MSRQIKFRVWDVLNNEMLYSSDKTANCFNIKLNGDVVDGNGCSYDETFPIMQYTGLKDENGKDVYEGDIIKFPQRTHCIYSEVTYSEYDLAFKIEDRFIRELLKHKIIVVIGNIYENKELLA